MTFEFRAHHPSAYNRFALILVALVAVNISIIAWCYPQLKETNEAAERSVVFILPWMVVLLLPSVVFGVIIYRSFVGTYHFSFHTVAEGGAVLTVVKADRKGVTKMKTDFSADQITLAQIIDFEDNHYCNLRFTEPKHDLVIHRETGDFENFLNELAAFAPDAIKVAN